MPGHDIIVIGASAGGVEALSNIVRGLPPNLPASLFVVLHVSPHSKSMLPQILNRCGSLLAFHPRDGEVLRHGLIYVAPPDHHLLVRDGYVTVVRGPHENGHRPAVDPLFRSAAQAYGNRVVGVVLSGALDDGTAGLMAVKQRGGVAVVQDPDEAFHPSMPRSAIEHVAVDYIVPLDRVPATLVDLAQREVGNGGKPTSQGVSEDMQIETGIAELESKALQNPDRPGLPSGLTCPDCHGALYEMQEGELLRYRCRVGHAYSMDSLLAGQSESLEHVLYAALRGLEEIAALSRRVAERARQRDQAIVARRFEDKAQNAMRNAEILRQLLLRDESESMLDDEVAAHAPTGQTPAAGDVEVAAPHLGSASVG